MLRVEQISASYGDFRALEDVSLEIPDSGITALLGPNAAGKTTTLRVVSGVVAARSGRVLYNGEDITKLSPADRVKRGIVHVPEGRKLFGTLTVEENLQLGGYSRRRTAEYQANLDRVYAFLPRLAERRKQLAGSLSGGEQQMCAVGRGLMSSPKVLMIDEMSLGLAPVIVKQLFGFVREIAREGVAVLIVEQQIQHALQIADTAAIIEKGVTVHAGAAAKLRDDPVILQAYLGV